MCYTSCFNFGSSHPQLIMLCMQAALMMLLPELWMCMPWQPLLFCCIYHRADNYCIHCCGWLLHLMLWIYVVSTCCGFTTATAVVSAKPPLWYFVHCCGPVLNFHCCGSVLIVQHSYAASTAVDIYIYATSTVVEYICNIHCCGYMGHIHCCGYMGHIHCCGLHVHSQPLLWCSSMSMAVDLC